MEVSLFLAKALGLYLLIISVGMIFNAARFRPLLLNIVDNSPLLFLSGFIALILGVLLVINHNFWTSDWRIAITIIAWLALIKGAVRVILPQMVGDLDRKWIRNDCLYYVSGGICLVVGIFLAYHGFMPAH